METLTQFSASPVLYLLYIFLLVNKCSYLQTLPLLAIDLCMRKRSELLVFLLKFKKTVSLQSQKSKFSEQKGNQKNYGK